MAQPAKPKPLRVFSHVLFAFDKSALDMRAQDTLDREVVVRFGEFGEVRFINIAGYTDRIGSVQYNQKLSERRAEAVKAYLVRQGANADKIQTTGYGKMYVGSTLLFVECSQKDRKTLIACLQPNRRAEIEVLGTGR
ncbi:MAG: OmpA family protein [Betaproteobacteria bacterium]|nr:OmpA family protein [Betaproteobacteria bacterium]